MFTAAGGQRLCSSQWKRVRALAGTVIFFYLYISNRPGDQAKWETPFRLTGVTAGAGVMANGVPDDAIVAGVNDMDGVDKLLRDPVPEEVSILLGVPTVGVASMLPRVG